MLLTLFLLPSARPLPVAPTQSAVVPNVVLCNLPAPTYCTAERTGPSTASITWGSVQNADAYQLKVYEQGSDQLVYSSTVHGTSINLEGLQSGQAYYCTVASVCTGGSASDFIIIENIAE